MNTVLTVADRKPVKLLRILCYSCVSQIHGNIPVVASALYRTERQV